MQYALSERAVIPMTTDRLTAMACSVAPARSVSVSFAGAIYPSAGRSFEGNRGLEPTVAA